METAEDNGIQLNLSSYEQSNNAHPRKSSFKRNNSSIKPATVSSPTVQNHEQSKPVKRKICDSGESIAPTKKKKPEQFISSLFRHNPDIPSVDRCEVNPVKEKVFTSNSFSDLPLHQFMISNLVDKMKLTRMTSIQQRTIPSLLNGGDLLIKSQTGSGKTLAYAIPIVQQLQGLTPGVQRADGPYAIVVVPTRELVIQSYETFCSLLRPFIWIVPGCLMGGEKRKAEKARIRKGINILVTTPGRLVDHLENTQGMSLSAVRYLVLDEADRLSDLGYEKDIARIVTALNTRGQTDRQTILLSATLSNGVERLAGMTLNDAQKISIGETSDLESSDGLPALSENSVGTDSSKTEVFSIPNQLQQQFVITPCKLRLVTLAAFVCSKCKKSTKKSKMVVFLSTQDSVEFHHALFTKLFVSDQAASVCNTDTEHTDSAHTDTTHTDMKLYKLHGEMPQKDRTAVFKEFCATSDGVLFCTDVASRGLHLPHVQWIVQYTSAGSELDYIHRVGRTARAGTHGQALLFMMPHEVDYIHALSKYQISLKELDMKSVLKTLMSLIQELPVQGDNQRENPRSVEEAASFLQMQFETCVHGSTNMLQLAKNAFQSFVRCYAGYPSHLKPIFQFKELHLGHLAKSFGLRDAPSNINTNTGSRHNSDKRKHKRFEMSTKGFKKTDLSEFGSGLSDGKLIGLGQRKKKKKQK